VRHASVRITRILAGIALGAATLLFVACDDGKLTAPPPPAAPTPAPSAAPAPPPRPVFDTVPESEMAEPVELWIDGKPAGKIDARGPNAGRVVVIDVGEGFTPVLFADGSGADGRALPHQFRPSYLALARGEFPDDPYGERAREDKYLELYGIMPTLSVLRERMRWARGLACAKELDLSAIEAFNGVVSYQSPQDAQRVYQRYQSGKKLVDKLRAEQGKADVAGLDLSALKELDLSALKERDKALIDFYVAEHDDTEAIKAAQARLVCEGYFKGKGKWLSGAFDWATHEALAEFERRHRVYSWGALGGETLVAMRTDTDVVEHQTVIRVLTERALHAFGAIEDGSAKNPDGTPATYTGKDGQQHLVPNLEAELRGAVVRGFGLSDPVATEAFLDALGTLPKDEHRYIAVPSPERPEYYAADMDLSVGIDRGDVWYEFPFDERGGDRAQPVSRRPRTTLFLTYLGQRFPLARFGTTIGGWKSEFIDGQVWWKYKGSPWGEVIWQEIVSAPVWLPPSSTPPRELLRRRPERKPGETKWVVNTHETGPSYASAYGLVAAYHRKFQRKPDGSVTATGDEGIRSHGSVDYMSIMRRHSHGCHRLHNHIAVRLFSFVVNHREHTREGHQPVSFWMDLAYDDEQHHVSIKRGGYEFRLKKPIVVNVEEGRVRGDVKRPIDVPIPKFNADCKAYLLPDGTAVLPHANGSMTPTSLPPGCVPPAPALPAGEPTAEKEKSGWFFGLFGNKN
jgi:hypothetical protein